MKPNLRRRVADAFNTSVSPAPPPEDLEKTLLSRLKPRTMRLPPAAVATMGALVLVLAAGNVAQWARVSEEPRLETILLEGVGTAQNAFGTILLDPEDHHGIVAVRDLPPRLAPGAYRLWMKNGSEVSSAGVFTVDTDGYGSTTLEVPADLPRSPSFFLSVEPSIEAPLQPGPLVMQGRKR